MYSSHYVCKLGPCTAHERMHVRNCEALAFPIRPHSQLIQIAPFETFAHFRVFMSVMGYTQHVF